MTRQDVDEVIAYAKLLGIDTPIYHHATCNGPNTIYRVDILFYGATDIKRKAFQILDDIHNAKKHRKPGEQNDK